VSHFDCFVLVRNTVRISGSRNSRFGLSRAVRVWSLLSRSRIWKEQTRLRIRPEPHLINMDDILNLQPLLYCSDLGVFYGAEAQAKSSLTLRRL
jgi:hypothetical protein